MKGKIKVLMVEPEKEPYTAEIGKDLRSMQEAVGGLIEVVYLGGDTLLICNDEGKLIGLQGNRMLDSGDIIAGPFFIARDDHQGNIVSLTSAQIESFSQRFGEPEFYTQEQVQDALCMEFRSF